MIAAVRSQPRGAARTKKLLESLLSPVAVCAFLTVVIVVASSAAASAQFILADPDGTVKGLASGWATQAIAWAKQIYFYLFILELVALAVTTLLFRENVGEFFASVGLKVFMGGIYFWFIMNAGVGGGWASQIISSFQNVGATFGTRDASWVTGEGLVAAGGYFLAGPVAQTAAQVPATAASLAIATATGSASAALSTPCVVALASITCPGYALAAPFLATIPPLQQTVNQAVNQTYPFTLITEGMGLMLLMALAAIWLQIIIMTIESYIVMGAGVLFIGFAGSRFTMPFSQGYFSYMFNVGVKFMVLYIVLGVEQQLMPGILVDAAATLATAAASAAIPGGEYLALATAAFGMMNVIIAAALVWMLPGLAGSFLTGQSSASGSAVLGQAMGTMASAAGMMANLHQAKRSDAAAKRHASDARDASAGASHTSVASGYGSNDNALTSPTTGTNTSGGGSSSDRAAANALGVPSTPKQDKDEPLLDQAADSRAFVDSYRASAMSSLASGAPRDIGGPTAVQVRLGNPDKL